MVHYNLKQKTLKLFPHCHLNTIIVKNIFAIYHISVHYMHRHFWVLDKPVLAFIPKPLTNRGDSVETNLPARAYPKHRLSNSCSSCCPRWSVPLERLYSLLRTESFYLLLNPKPSHSKTILFQHRNGTMLQFVPLFCQLGDLL